ncbi:TPR repeat-containing protein [Calothrix sp. NIES-4101]|nr:TPR repeat-containing protein [Calothrix sp. NIES-4101]
MWEIRQWFENSLIETVLPSYLRGNGEKYYAHLRQEGLGEESEAYLKFLLEILRVTAKNPGDAKVVYPLLQANTDKLNSTLGEVLRIWATDTILEIKPNEALLVARAIGNFSVFISQLALDNKASNTEIAITGYEIALNILTSNALSKNWVVNVTRNIFSKHWAMMQYNLGNAYYNRIMGDQAENLEKEISAYNHALEVFNPTVYPEYWAITQHNLGCAYSDRILGEHTENLEKAIAAHTAALTVYTRTKFPEDWAMTQFSLGNSYTDRLSGERAENLEKAIAAYNAALEVRTRTKFPESWANTKHNLGKTYIERILGNKSNNLELAIAAFNAALEVYTPSANPQYWAMTQDSLGNAYSDDRLLGERAENLEKAIAAYNAALEVRTRTKFPEDWARTQLNLGNAYSKRIMGDRAENLEKAIVAHNNALSVFTRTDFTHNWANIQSSLGSAYNERIKGNPEKNLEQAIAAYNNALSVYKRTDFPQEWAMVQTNLVNAFLKTNDEERAENLENAIKACKAAIEIYTRIDFPERLAAAQINLGNIYLYRIKSESANNLEIAITYYNAALEVINYNNFPEQWAKIQNNLGNAYLGLFRIAGNREVNFERAIAAYSKALTVRTSDALPEDHAKTLSNIGITYQDAKILTEAYKAFQSAIETVEILRDEIISGNDTKRKQAEQWNDLHRRMVEVCLELGNHTEAIEYVERSKTRNLIELILERDSKIIFPPEVVTQLERYRDEIATGQYQIQNGKAENPKVIAKHLQELRQQRNKLQNQYLPVGYGFKFDSFQATLDEHTAIIEWYLLNDKILAFIVKPKGEEALLALWIKWYREIQKIKLVEAAKLNLWFISLTYYLISREVIVWQSQPEDLEALVNWVGEYLQDYYKTGKNQWRDKLDERLKQLSEILYLESILDLIPEEQYNRLILIPHRFLHLLPIHALPVGGSYLLDRFSQGVGYAPSCQLLQEVQQRKRPDFQSLFAVQNPTGDLQFTNQEVNSILSIFPSHQVLSNSKATKAALDEATPHLQKANYLHFSCHGSFNPDSPFLLLADAIVSSIPANADPQQYLESSKGFIDLSKCLTLGNLFERGFDLNKCRLVVLSACETGLIDFNNNSDEYIGLPSGFLYAGSSSVVTRISHK